MPICLFVFNLSLNFVELVDQDALVEALKEKRIRGAGLDVMTPEPLPLDHPLMSLDNVCTCSYTIIVINVLF